MAKRTRTREITMKEKLVVLYYLENGNLSEAYKKAYQSKGKPNYLWNKGNEVMLRPQVKEFYDKVTGKELREVNVKVTDTIKRLWELVNIDIGDFFDDDGVFIYNIPKKYKGMIQQFYIDTDTGRLRGVQLPDKISAIKEINKCLQAYDTRTQNNTQVNINVKELEVEKLKEIHKIIGNATDFTAR